VPAPQKTADHRRAAAERSVEAILAATERLLASNPEASMSAIAGEAGVSRVTLYAHFPTRTAVLEAVAERVIAEGAEAIAAAGTGAGEPAAALDRLIDAAWGKLDRNLELFAAARADLSEEALRRAHEQLDAPILALIKRGQRADAFRSDVSAGWLLTSYYALMHAAAGEAAAGRLPASKALAAVKSTIRRAFGVQ
jgi:TetR/AcrR family transcriptional regulator, mexCD-oprJ operon repressor